MPFGICENVVFQVAHRIPKGKTSLELCQTLGSASLTLFNPRRLDKLLYREAVLWRQAILLASLHIGSQSAKQQQPEDSPGLHVQEQKGRFSFSKEKLNSSKYPSVGQPKYPKIQGACKIFPSYPMLTENSIKKQDANKLAFITADQV